MFELESVTDVTVASEVETLKQVREALCNASASLPVQGFGNLHDHLGRTSQIVSGYIEALTTRDRIASAG